MAATVSPEPVTDAAGAEPATLPAWLLRRAGDRAGAEEAHARAVALSGKAAERAALERQRLFRELPMFMGLTTRLPKPGDYLTEEVAGMPVLMTRGADGCGVESDHEEGAVRHLASELDHPRTGRQQVDRRRRRASVPEPSGRFPEVDTFPGKQAPVLITADAVRGMLPGSVIVDLAAERGDGGARRRNESFGHLCLSHRAGGICAASGCTGCCSRPASARTGCCRWSTCRRSILRRCTSRSNIRAPRPRPSKTTSSSQSRTP